MGWLIAVVVWCLVSFVVVPNIGSALHGQMGSVLSVLCSQGVFWGAVVVVSQHLFPLPRFGDQFKAVRCFVTWLVNAGGRCYAAKDGKVESRLEGGLLGVGPGVMLLDTNTAVVLEQYGRLSRVCGPGVRFVHWAESARGAADLRPQIRRLSPVNAVTRDGIPVESRVMVMFQIAPMASPVDGQFPQQPYGCDEQTVHWAVYYTPIQAGQSPDWGDLLPTIAADHARTVINEHKLDEIFRPENPRLDAWGDIKGKYRAAFKQALKDMGINVVIDGAGCGLPRPPVAVTEQRVRSWRTPWMGKVLETQAQGEAEALAHMERARAAAQREMIKTILNSFDELGGTIPKDLVRMRLMTALEHMLADPSTRELVPQTTLGRLNDFLQLSPPKPPAAQGDR